MAGDVGVLSSWMLPGGGGGRADAADTTVTGRSKSVPESSEEPRWGSWLGWG